MDQEWSQLKLPGLGTGNPLQRLLGKLRVQLVLLTLVQFLFACLPLAYVAATGETPFANGDPSIYSDQVLRTALMCLPAGWLGIIALRQLSEFPGSQTAVYILPSMVTAFSMLGLLVFVFRLDHGRAVVIISMIGALFWVWLDYMIRERHTVPSIGILPEGNLRSIQTLPGVNWTRLKTPDDVEQRLDMIVADLNHKHASGWERFLAGAVLKGIPVHDVKSIKETLTGRVQMEHLSENAFGSVLPSSLYMKIKRMADLLASLLVLPVVLVVILVVALLIKLESAGPAFFVQDRMGFRAKIFRMYKLRSMKQEVVSGLAYTEQNDPRITRTGRLIRKYRIDELPQIFNIIKGEMSWIGPRPEPLAVASHYEKELPFYIYRQSVRPGITGWAQVSQGYVAYLGEEDASAEKLQYDFYYIKNFSAWLDALIVLRTAYTCFDRLQVSVTVRNYRLQYVIEAGTVAGVKADLTSIKTPSGLSISKMDC
jgi:lipopolysaccharide/colanic/teichoic acid biosynthesis glycosyltransferase